MSVILWADNTQPEDVKRLWAEPAKPKWWMLALSFAIIVGAQWWFYGGRG